MNNNDFGPDTERSEDGMNTGRKLLDLKVIKVQTENEKEMDVIAARERSAIFDMDDSQLIDDEPSLNAETLKNEEY